MELKKGEVFRERGIKYAALEDANPKINPDDGFVYEHYLSAKNLLTGEVIEFAECIPGGFLGLSFYERDQIK